MASGPTPSTSPGTHRPSWLPWGKGALLWVRCRPWALPGARPGTSPGKAGSVPCWLRGSVSPGEPRCAASTAVVQPELPPSCGGTGQGRRRQLGFLCGERGWGGSACAGVMVPALPGQQCSSVLVTASTEAAGVVGVPPPPGTRCSVSCLHHGCIPLKTGPVLLPRRGHTQSWVTIGHPHSSGNALAQRSGSSAAACPAWPLTLLPHRGQCLHRGVAVSWSPAC